MGPSCTVGAANNGTENGWPLWFPANWLHSARTVVHSRAEPLTEQNRYTANAGPIDSHWLCCTAVESTLHIQWLCNIGWLSTPWGWEGANPRSPGGNATPCMNSHPPPALTPRGRHTPKPSQGQCAQGQALTAVWATSISPPDSTHPSAGDSPRLWVRIVWLGRGENFPTLRRPRIGRSGPQKAASAQPRAANASPARGYT
jgi:hypothetical protein